MTDDTKRTDTTSLIPVTNEIIPTLAEFVAKLPEDQRNSKGYMVMTIEGCHVKIDSFGSTHDLMHFAQTAAALFTKQARHEMAEMGEVTTTKH